MRLVPAVTATAAAIYALTAACPTAHATATIQRLATAPVSSPNIGGVAIQGPTLLVGAPYFNSPVSTFDYEGAAFVYDANTAAKVRELDSSRPWQGERFGESVALSGNLALVGAPDGNSGSFADDTGAAYLLNLTTGQALFRLLPSDLQRSGHFGHAVAVSGSRAIVGAPWNSATGDLMGNAYLFNTATGAQIAKLTVDDATPRRCLGNSVAIEGPTAVVGASGGFTTSVGDAYLFDANTGAQRARLFPPGLVTGSHFGISVGISGDLVLVGSDNTLGGPGAAYLFDAQTGNYLRTLAPPDGSGTNQFGAFVAIEGNIALVSAIGGTADSYAGAVYAFDVRTGKAFAKFTAPDAQPNLEFGFGLDLDGTTAVIGAGQPAATYLLTDVPEPASALLLLPLLPLMRRPRRQHSSTSVDLTAAIGGASSSTRPDAPHFD